MNEIILYKSPLKALLLIAGFSLFAFPGFFFIITKDNTEFAVWVATCLYTLGCILGFFNLFDRRPQIIINNKGIWDRRLKFETIFWDDITNAYLYHIRIPFYKIKIQSFISLALKPEISDKIKTLKWVENLNYKIGGQKVNLNVSNLKVNKDKLLSAIEQLSAEQPENRAEIISKLNLK